MSRLATSARFTWALIVGDDWLAAAAVAVATAATAMLARTAIDAWWLLPAAVAVVLSISLRRASRE